MAKRGRKYREALERIEPDRRYSPRDGFALLKEIDQANYDSTVECAFRLGIDPRKADQMIRGAVGLPHGVGKSVSVAVVASGDKVAEAKEAGADHAGGDEIVEQLAEGALVDEIDAVIATPDMMGKLGRLGKTLGPKGLMPNPKSGTVTTDVGKAVSEIKAGRVEYRADRNGNVHATLGKRSFTVDQLVDNFRAISDEIVRQRPSATKGRYIRTVAVSTSASPSIQLEIARAKDAGRDDQE